jgi:hypothetical protein
VRDLRIGRGEQLLGPLRAEVRAESIERAVRLAYARYSGCKARVLLPIDPITFFAAGDGSGLRTPLVGGRGPEGSVPDLSLAADVSTLAFNLDARRV